MPSQWLAASPARSPHNPQRSSLRIGRPWPGAHFPGRKSLHSRCALLGGCAKQRPNQSFAESRHGRLEHLSVNSAELGALFLMGPCPRLPGSVGISVDHSVAGRADLFVFGPYWCWLVCSSPLHACYVDARRSSARNSVVFRAGPLAKANAARARGPRCILRLGRSCWLCMLHLRPPSGCGIDQVTRPQTSQGDLGGDAQWW